METTGITHQVIDAIASIFIVIATKMYFDSLLMQKRSEKVTIIFWVCCYLITSPFSDYIPIKPQIVTLLMYIIIITMFYKDKWYKKLFSFVIINVINIALEGVVYFTVRVDLNEGLNQAAGIFSKALSIIFIIFFAQTVKKFKKDIALNPKEWIDLIVCPLTTGLAILYVMFSKQFGPAPVVIVCTCFVIINTDAVYRLYKAMRSKEELGERDITINRQKDLIAKKKKEIKEVNEVIHKTNEAIRKIKPIMVEFGTVTNKILVDINKITIVHMKGKEVVMCIKDGESHSYRGTLTDVLKSLNENGRDFIQVNLSHIINVRYINGRKGDDILVDNKLYRVTPKYKKAVDEKYNSLVGVYDKDVV